MASSIRDFTVSRITLVVLAIIECLIIVGGIILTFSLVNGRYGSEIELFMSLGGAGLAVLAALGGLVGLAFVINAQANIQSAEIAWEMLELARRVENEQNQTKIKQFREASLVATIGQAETVEEKMVIPRTHSGDIDREALVAHATSVENYENRGRSHELLMFPGGKVKVIVDGQLLEFQSKIKAYRTLDRIEKK